MTLLYVAFFKRFASFFKKLVHFIHFFASFFITVGEMIHHFACGKTMLAMPNGVCLAQRCCPSILPTRYGSQNNPLYNFAKSKISICFAKGSLCKTRKRKTRFAGIGFCALYKYEGFNRERYGYRHPMPRIFPQSARSRGGYGRYLQSRWCLAPPDPR